MATVSVYRKEPTVEVVESVFPLELADQLSNAVGSLQWTYGWRSNRQLGHAHWNCELAKADSSNGLDVSPALTGVFKEAWDTLSAGILSGGRLVRCYANAHTYGVEGYPHMDSIRESSTTLVCYLNKSWRPEWAGETVIFDGDSIKRSVLPKFNLGVHFSGYASHCARSVSRTCPELRTTLMFKCVPEGEDPARDKLQTVLTQFGANSVAHRTVTLMRHLLNTYDLLKRVGQDEDVCLAGGIHSVFGTDFFKTAIVPVESKALLESTLGARAVYLSEVFSCIKRIAQLDLPPGLDLQTLDGSYLRVSANDLRDLQIIECANLHDQRSLGNWPNLTRLWQSLGGMSA